MSATNAISGISLVGSLVVAGGNRNDVATVQGVIAVTCATINCVGGFIITGTKPRTAWAAVNFRIRPGQTRPTVLARVKDVIADERVGGSAGEGISSSDPSPVSPVDAQGYRLIEKTIRSVFPGTVVAPNATNSRFFTRISSQVHRFVPATFRAEDLPRLHGIDERVVVADYADMVRFYRQLLIDAQAP